MHKYIMKFEKFDLIYAYIYKKNSKNVVLYMYRYIMKF